LRDDEIPLLLEAEEVAGGSAAEAEVELEKAGDGGSFTANK